MRNIFIADAHLKQPGDANYRSLLRFLDTLPPDTDTLYILGDLFEFWVGSPTPVYRHYREVVDSLKRVRGRGVRLVYFEGNHDFHLTRFFREELQAEVHRRGAIVTIGSQQVYLCHGDQINRRDYRYRAFRLLLHSRLAGVLLPLFPRGLAGAVAAILSRLSGKRHKVRRVRWDRRAITLSFARGCFGKGCDAVVTGHFHLPYLEREGERVVVSLGDWITQFSYCEWLDGEFTLKTFPQ
ncbi:UDP-2,3-diacylglucosamine diphosphatase [Geomonas sp. RF6]|uniref:UDP-2,3-diacylglucosamine diphosphatase n=1 Tax=Geomonas sp. RF6 TaxID=2897342 RepID=UPI001E2F27A1|nr:UDP-2,3-diacylglucosamine diphosphatase [Geomonas sp. RF6]UFS71610.1 UDP-2,3-diacylglucosamine diphosphatase [Geomonas sp. RF6]